MKKEFIEFYAEKLNFRELDNNTIVVFDANTLLHIYRYSKEATSSLMKSMKSVKNNIWLPYQIALEFHRNRQTVKWEVIEKKKTIINKANIELNDYYGKVIEIMKEYKIRSIDSIKISEEIEKDLRKDFDDFFEKSVKEKLNSYLNVIDSETDILDDVLALFEGKVGKPFSKERLGEIVKEGQIRYKNKIPPGYKDDTEKKGHIFHGKDYEVESKYGDLIYWKEIIEHAKDKKLEHVIIVSDDMKEDWIYETKGKKIGARIELKKELLDEAQCSLIIINTNKFINLTLGNSDKVIIENNSDIDKNKIKRISRLNRFNSVSSLQESKERLINKIEEHYNLNYSEMMSIVGLGMKVPSELVDCLDRLSGCTRKVLQANDIEEISEVSKEVYFINKHFNHLIGEFTDLLI